MLAQNFLSADELGLFDREYLGMKLVLDMLERGELTWTPRNKPIENGFNMGPYWDEGPNSCGTVGCIAGWAAFLTQGSTAFPRCAQFIRTSEGEKFHEFHRLICPTHSDDRTVEETAHALRTYLTTGHADWQPV